MSKYNINYKLIPEYMREDVRLYLEEGFRPGDFLRAVLENNLVEAFAKADMTNRLAMFDWAGFLYNEMPTGSWGSKEKVDAFLEGKWTETGEWITE